MSSQSDQTYRLAQELITLSSRSGASLRGWYVNRVVLSDASRNVLAQLEPPEEVVDMASGNAPTPEHSGISARLLYEHMNQPLSVLTQLPLIEDPKSWNNSAQMTEILLWAFEPWKQFRYDPKAETIHTVLTNGQWAAHLKGKDSDNYLIVRVQNYIHQLGKIPFMTLVEAMSEQGLVSLTPPEGMAATDFVRAMEASESFFGKWTSRVSAVKEVMDQIQRIPIMYFDTSTQNTISNLAAFGNGVVPTEDIIDHTPEGPEMIVPAGKLIPADREYLLSSATGLAWEPDDHFNELISFRQTIHSGYTDDTWDDWIRAAEIYQSTLLERRCPTYLSFLNHAFPPNADTGIPDERDAFLRLLGAAVFGNNLKIVAAMIGAPNAGKDTVIKWLSLILGDQVGVLSPIALTAAADDQRAFAPLKGARLAVVSGEVGEGRNSAILAEKVKSITSGGGTLTVAEKYEKPTTIFFDGMLIMQGNSVPTIQGGDKALYKNRLVAVEFKHPFPLQANSYEREYRAEAPYFLQVLFLAYLDYVERGGGMTGIDPPASWRAFSEDVEFSADSLAVIDRCLTRPQRGVEIPSGVFYKALSVLAERQLGLRYPISAQKWAHRLKRAGIDLDKTKNTPWRSRVNRSDYKGWMMHFTLDAENSDGLFTDTDWQHALDAARMSVV